MPPSDCRLRAFVKLQLRFAAATTSTYASTTEDRRDGGPRPGINRAEISGWKSSANYSRDRWFAALTAQTMDGRDTETGLNLRDFSPHSTNASVGAYLIGGKARIGLDSAERTQPVSRASNRITIPARDVGVTLAISDKLSIGCTVVHHAVVVYSVGD